MGSAHVETSGPESRVDQFGAVEIAGVTVQAMDRSAAAEAIVAAGRARAHLSVHLCNAYVLALAAQDREYELVLRRGDLNLADGAPVAWFARRAGLDAAQRPSGTELLLEVARRGVDDDLGHLFYGGTHDVAAALEAALPRQVPGVRISHLHAPPFGAVTQEQADDLLQRAADSDADVIWIGLGTPKQDLLVDLVTPFFAGPVIPIGAAFDFVAGSKRRAPRWMQRLGLEWIHRLATEPRRLWRRYLWGNVRFLLAVAVSGRVVRHRR